MRPLAYLLEELRCACCGAINTLWIDLHAGGVECRECGQTATLDQGSGL